MSDGPEAGDTGRRTIVAITGSRGEWGYLRPILRLIDADPDLDHAIVATNMHLLSEFGMSVHEIERDGFVVAERIHMTFDGYTAATMTKSLAVFLLELPGVLERLRPDVLLLAGDRGEQLMAAIAGAHLGIPVAHIQAGELSGNVDGIVRHAITKLAHLHFAANEQFAERVRRLGEQPFRIHATGAPLVDELVAGPVTSREELDRRYRIAPDTPFVLAVQHPVTEEEGDAGRQAAVMLEALVELDLPTFFVYPNSDAGSDLIRAELDRLRRPGFRFFRNLPREDYLGLMAAAATMVGNSSSGIMEAPTFGTPAVNVGRRQIGRLQAANVINVPFELGALSDALRRATSAPFRAQAAAAVNPYGDGHASARIVDVLKHVKIDRELLDKEMEY